MLTYWKRGNVVLVLDAGSGTDKLDTARGNVCIDLCKRPRNKPQNFICADAHHLPFRGNVFDKVTFYEVIEHVESPTKCLTEIHRVLKEKCLLELTTPNIYHWRIVLRQIRGLSQVLSDTGHIACWSKTELQNILVNTGFLVIEFKFATLPLIFSPHRILDKIAHYILPSSINERNLIVYAVK